jgi:hypothetical protein
MVRKKGGYFVEDPGFDLRRPVHTSSEKPAPIIIASCIPVQPGGVTVFGGTSKPQLTVASCSPVLQPPSVTLFVGTSAPQLIAASSTATASLSITSSR